MRSFPVIGASRLAALKVGARLVAGGYAAFAALNAQAEDRSPVAGAFGNTIVTTYPDGQHQKIWLHPDGTWAGLSRRRLALAGSWRLDGGKICLRQSQPATLPLSYCTVFPPHSEPGAQWAGRDMAGRPITLSIQKGLPPDVVGGASVQATLGAATQRYASPQPITR